MDVSDAPRAPDTALRDEPAQRWLPSVEPATLVPQGSRVVVVAPHPDDEVLGTGGLLANWASLGRRICIVAVTDGGASHPRSTHWTAEALSATRRAESVEGWRHLGLARGVAHRLGLPDGALAAHAATLTERLCDLLTSEDVVFATWRLDGHPDHDATGRAAALACQRRGCRLFEYPVWMWHWAAPADKRVPWERLRRAPIGARALAQKSRAVQAHATQLRADGDAAPVLPPAMLSRWLSPFEHLFVPAAPRSLEGWRCRGQIRADGRRR